MLVDTTTLALAGGFVTSLSGVFLLVYWWQDRAAWSALWWALGNCLQGAGIIIIALHSVLPFLLSFIVAPLLLDVCAVFAFVAARAFSGGLINPRRMISYVVAWLTIMTIAGGLVPEQISAATGVATSSGFYWAAALQFWLGRGEKLRGRGPMIGVITLYAVALFLLALDFATANKYVAVLPISWFSVIHFVGLVYALGGTMLLITMLNARTEAKHKVAALTDPLTGLANRRDFMDRAERVLDRAGQDGDPVALLAFDLDRFKLINDTFGHATGDAVLRVFADVLSRTLRPTNLTARLGGEEFVAVVLGAGDEAAVAIASRVCDAFQKAGQNLDGQEINATVSAGVVTTGGETYHVADLLASADAALYRAKHGGRNRAVLGGIGPVGLPVGNVVRIA